MDMASTTKKVIENNYHMVVATADTAGKPWVSPLFYMYDEDLNLYWVSGKTALHSQNIRSNPRVAVCIFGPATADEPDSLHGIYFDAEAQELTDEAELSRAVQIMQQRAQPEKYMIKSLADVTGDAAWRVYKATPHEISKRQDAIDEASGQTISIRKKVEL